MNSNLLRDRSGFGVNIEPLICVTIVAIIAIIAVIRIPSLQKDWVDGNRLGGTAQCMKKLLVIRNGQEGFDFRQLVCPVVERPYRITEREGGEVLSCPDPDQHLGFVFQLVKDGESWKLDATLPDFPHPENVALEVSGAKAILRASADSVTIESMPDWQRYIALAIGIWCSVVYFFFPGLSLSVNLFEKSKPSAWGLFKVLAKVPVILVLFLIGLLILYRAGTGALASERVTLSKKDGVVIQTYWVGKAWSAPTRIDKVVGVFPVLSERNFKAMLFYEADGEIRSRVLFGGPRNEWNRVSLAHDLFSAPPVGSLESNPHSERDLHVVNRLVEGDSGDLGDLSEQAEVILRKRREVVSDIQP